MGDVRRKRTRKSSHASRSPRSFEVDQQSSLPEQQSKLQGNGYGQIQKLETSGYEGMTYLTSPQIAHSHQVTRDTGIVQGTVLPLSTTPSSNTSSENRTPPKKPAGILKTSGSYSINQQNVKSEFFDHFVFINLWIPFISIVL